MRSDSETGRTRAWSDVAAGVVLFRPDRDLVVALTRRLVADGTPLFMFANGPLEPATEAALGEAAPDLRVMRSERNLGIAAALNALCKAALGAGHNAIVLFDQDSRLEPDHAARLGRARDRLAGAGHRPGTIGPRPLVPTEEGDTRKAPAYRARPGIVPLGPLAPVQFLATSGSLIDLAAWREVGPFREDFFIDAVDTEWCFRAWAHGFSCWQDGDTVMKHRVGEGVIAPCWLPVRMPRQKPFRMETYLRNSLFCWRLPHVPLAWKARQVLYLPLQVLAYWADAKFRPALLARLVRALRDGAVGRLGPPRSFS